MTLQELFSSFAVVFVLLGTVLLFMHSFAPVTRSQERQITITLDVFHLFRHISVLLKYSLLSIAQMPPLLLLFLILYGLVLSFYYWYQRMSLGLTGLLGLSILTTIISLGIIALILSPILFMTRKYLFDDMIESRIFRIAIYSVMVPFLYIFIIHDLTPGPLVEGIMFTGIVISYYQIFRGIIYCLQTPRTFFSYLDSRFIPILMIVSWLFVIIFNLYTMILLVSNTNPYSFIDSTGPVTEHIRLLYFTIITFTSVGYGDITPRGNFPVFITMIISITGFLYSALFIGGLLAAFTSRSK
ncbi:Ion transport 2 domain protein [Desulforamulus reducens MI-1]|uniref:Ion transport 2 domain protein n=1 Tax=Desulforamulus reducens (strain ATCC BAA-1160 / DSM 100696 / MI-1) TaxID=349161 RepID=A4J3Q4_DESRM|nr:ion channel [Desulforamulus reducens]ABO49707.1 Ion transport 2 domain protein [Desulforamulus reducens MI-1]